MSFVLKDLEKNLSKDSINSVYLLLGKDVFLQKESLKLIVDKIIVSPEYKDFNYNVFYAKDVDARVIREAIETLPVFSDRRLIICHDAHLLKEKDWEVLMPVLENPSSSFVLVLVASELDRRKKFSKKIIEHCFVVDNKSPTQKELGYWVQKLASSYGLQLSSEASQLLVRWTGSSILSMDSELKKIKSFLGSRSHVTEKDIVQVVSRVRPESIFLFTEAIGKKDLKKSFHFLIHLLEDQESEVGIIALVNRHFHILSQVKEGLKAGLRHSELSSKVGVPSFFIKDYIQQVSLWDDKSMAQVIEALYETDRALKSSPISSDIWLENFVLKACTV